MKQRQTKRFSAALAAFLAFVLLFCALPAPVFAVTQAEIDELERKKEAIEEKVEEKQAVVDELEEKQAGVLEQKKALDERNDYLYEQLNINAEQIALYNELIAQKAREVDAAKAKELEQLERYRRRVRAMEENGQADFLAMLLNANSLGEFLTAIDDIGEIMESDKMLEDAYIAARENTERVKADYEQYKTTLEAKKEELNTEKVRIEAEINEAAELLEKIKGDIDTYSEELAELEQAQKDAEELIEKKIAELEEQRRREEEAAAAAAAGGEGGGGGYYSDGPIASGNFIWPCACTYITSRVGGRIHPISGVYKYHSGMDVGCQYGDAVWASDSGTVILAGDNGGYGNCVMIDHGFVNGDHYYTLYGHLSAIYVSYGQAVSQGETIGAVGSTGVSTGPHLHFEIRNSSGPTDFNWRFESFLTYAPDA